MLYQLIEKLDANFKFETVSAHCDIPCKIYDPHQAQLCILTMIRMVELLNELVEKSSLSVNEQAQFQRLINEKEQHGRKLKEEITVIWGDYFKAPQIDNHPGIHELTHAILLATSAAKQHIDMVTTEELLLKVNRFAEIFWQTKGIETYVATSPCPPHKPVVYPKIG